MPQAAVAAIGAFVVSAGATAVASIALKVFAYVASSYLLNRAAQAMSPKRRSSGLGAGTEVNYFDSGASVRIVYGKIRVGGMETIPPITTNAPSSSDNEDLHKVLTIAGHEVDSYLSTNFDNTTIANTYLAPMAFTTSDGMVNSGGPFAHKAFIRHYRGTSTDSADRILIAANSGMFSNFRGRGIAKMAVTFRYHPDLYKSVPVVTTTVQGKRCYDPRLDSSPGANPTNATYIVWTQNPALCLCDYLTSSLGGSYASTDIDWDTVVTAANYCAALVNIPGALTQARYTCNGVLYATEEFTENLKALVDSMLGRVIFRDGKWRVYAGSWQTPTFTIQKSDWISGLSIRFEQGRKNRFNQMRTWFVDSEREWQRVESLPRSNATYKTADGEELIDAETEQLLCTSQFEAQRKGEFLLRQSRNQITVTGRLPPRFQDTALWDTGTIVFDHLGWSSKTFRAAGIDMNPDGSMDCVFAEEQSSDWTDLAAGDYNSPSTHPLPAVNDPVYLVPAGALQLTTLVSCLTSQVFSGAGAIHASELARIDINPASLDYNADVHVVAQYRTGLQNINGFQNVVMRFVSGVTSVYDSPYGFPVGGSTSAMQPQTQVGRFAHAKTNSCYVMLQWDVASGANSFTIDQVTLKADFYRRRAGYI